MSISFVAFGTSSASTTSSTPGMPAGLATDDVMFLFCMYKDDTGDGSAGPSGWTLTPGMPLSNGANKPCLKVWYRRFVSGDTGPTVPDQDQMQYTIIGAWRGVRTAAVGVPWDVTTAGTEAADITLDATGATTTHDGCEVIVCASREIDSSAPQYSNWVNADLTGFAEIHDAGSALGTGGGLGIAAGTKTTAGTYATSTADIASTTDCWTTIALIPGQDDTTLGRFQAVMVA